MAVSRYLSNWDYLCPAPGFVSRLHGVYTVILFCLLAVLHVVMKTLYFGTPIACWSPPHFTMEHTIYLHKVW